MKKKTFILTICLTFLVMAFAADPTAHYEHRYTVLTTEQTTVTLPGGVPSIELILINNGTGRLYYKLTSGTINTSTDLYIESGEKWPPIHAPWTTLELLAGTSSCEVQIMVAY